MSFEADVAAALREAAVSPAAFDFDAWALRVFAHQYERVPAYRAFCDRRGVTPATIARTDDVPAVPARVFRTLELATGPAEAVFRTSGTSGGADARGRHAVPHLDLYRAAALSTFERFVLPDRARLPCLFLLPPPALRPDSSLVHMCAWVGDAFGTRVEWFAGADGLDVARLAVRLAEVESTGEAVLLAGPTAGFVRLFDAGTLLKLGPGSRLMDTGGQKGLTRPISRAGFLRACWTHLGLPTYWCVNEYGMTELCSQRYDAVLRDRFAGNSLAPRRLAGPPWLRTRVLDPDTLDVVAAGATGLLCHHDLANAGSVSMVLTEDLGRTVGDDGIEVLGRVPGAVPRGCGLLLAELEQRVTAALAASIDAALAARARLAARPVRATAAALEEAARRWCDDADLVAALPSEAGLTTSMVRAVLPLVAEAIDADALEALHAANRVREPRRRS